MLYLNKRRKQEAFPAEDDMVQTMKAFIIEICNSLSRVEEFDSGKGFRIL